MVFLSSLESGLPLTHNTNEASQRGEKLAYLPIATQAWISLDSSELRGTQQPLSLNGSYGPCWVQEELIVRGLQQVEVEFGMEEGKMRSINRDFQAELGMEKMRLI
eukprot:c22639_g3_i2 orf=3-317(-)